MLDAWATVQKIAIIYSRHNKHRNSGTHCVVTLFKSKVIMRVNVEYQFASFQNTVCNFAEKWNAYNVEDEHGFRTKQYNSMLCLSTVN